MNENRVSGSRVSPSMRTICLWDENSFPFLYKSVFDWIKNALFNEGTKVVLVGLNRS